MKKIEKNLKNRKIAVLMADGFEMAEYTVPVNALRLAGADITVVSLRRGRIRGVNLHEPARKVHVDLTVNEAAAADFVRAIFAEDAAICEQVQSVVAHASAPRHLRAARCAESVWSAAGRIRRVS